MSIGILGRKLGMTQIYNETGQAVPVTVIQAGPCPVVALRTPDKNGYSAVLLGFGEMKPHKLTKPVKGQFDKVNVEPQRYLREFRLGSVDGYEIGQAIDVSLFKEGEKINVVGMSKGKGFAGVIKRFNFGGTFATHGVSKTHRHPGSSGASSYPGKIFKGKTMPGRMGGERVTVKNLTVVAVDTENNLLLVKGAVPGTRNGIITVYKQD
ncbi:MULTISPECIES: 50S ribosomal protein L3 [Aminobacterium]|jgi:large subunit ribosomal protein L3|uniref:50S ribosomal protein L3 n=1 Tax=Aminobacterium TaxID=81466 RepID=UPI00257D5AC8|nr:MULTISPECIES: 50S ribosomal protein L3 [unclassified Aminobacterium]